MPQRQEVANFIRSTFRSVWSLELLCFLRANPGQAHRPEELVAAIRGSELVVSQSVDGLLAAGLVVVEEDGAVRYAPASPDLDRLAEGAEAMYARSPDAVRRMIVSAANPGITAFADAFRLRKD